MDMQKIAKAVEAIAQEAGKLITDESHAEVFVKSGHANFVTSMDIACQKQIIAALTPLIEGAHFFAEEKSDNEMEPGYNWIIDPIDGTANYMYGFNHSSISIGLVCEGKGVLGVVHNPFLRETFTGIAGEGAFLNGKPFRMPQRDTASAIVAFGSSPYYTECLDMTMQTVAHVMRDYGDIRRTGSAALDICYAASGKVDAFFEALLQPWDYAAGTVIAEAAGATIRPIHVKRLDYCHASGIVVGNPELCDDIEAYVDAFEAQNK